MQSRRQFIATTGASVVAGGLVGYAPQVEASGKRPGEIIRVTADGMLKRGRPIQVVTSKMLDLCIAEYTGKSKPADGWATMFSDKDLVGVKINCLGKPKMSTTPEVVNAVVAGLKSAGVKDDRIVVFDMYGGHMRMSRFRLKDKDGAVRYVHNKTWGYEKEWRRHASGKTKLAQALLRATKIVNVPVIKDHALSGVTGALKNMAFGTIINPGRHHRNKGSKGRQCDPHIANIYNLPEIRDKVTLIVCDGAFLQYDGGPQFNAGARKPFNSLFVTTDPVALDKMMWEYVDEFRKAKRKRSLKRSRREPVHIATAAGLKLGTDDRAKIKLVEKKI